jgi:hypothetical protein
MRTFKELYDLNWLSRPTAMTNYLKNPSLQERYKTYDSYISSIYQTCRNNWNNGSGSTHEEIKKSYYSNDASETVESSELAEVITLSNRDRDSMLDSLENPPEPTSALIGLFKKGNEAHNQPFKGKVVKLKPYKKKIKNNTRLVNNICPNCLSTLRIDVGGVWICSKDRLIHWEAEFLAYIKLNEEQKAKYLLRYQDDSQFLNLFEKWSVVESGGHRPLWGCDFSNKLFNPISKFRSYLLDPCLVKTIERQLGRELTEQEIRGESEIWQYGGQYFDTYRKDSKKVKIPVICFPTDVIN